ncbi:MAG: sporulation protein YunB [Oscillospiraceae bacterium]|nr:sporulation protein YunB [Oscillospiraceae bacterium]
MKKRRKRNYNHKFRTAVLAIILTAAAFIYVDLRLRPAVITVAQYHIQSLINKAVNNAIISVMDKTQYSYDDLVEINRNSADEIVSVNYNSLHINKLRSELIKVSIEETQKIPVSYVYIPIGNITSIDILQNKGPKLKFTVTPSSYVEAEVESVFQNTGINQINHQIFITVKVTANALIPNYSTSVYSENKVCVAETVIIGKVPDSIGNNLIHSGDN